MANSSILGAESAPAQPSGRSNDVLGPSDNSDSGSDAVGTYEALSDSDSQGTGERGAVAGPDPVAGADIMPDHVVRMDADEEEEGDAPDDGSAGSGEGYPAADIDAREFTELANDPDAGDDDV